MSTRADMSATLQDPDSRSVRPARNISIAIIGPHIGRRGVVAKAVSSAEGRTVREFATYPDKVTELPRLLAQGFDVVMIDLDSDQNYALQLVQEVASTSSANVIVYSSRNDPTLGMISSHAGATDFLPIPADSSEEEGFNPPPAPERPAIARPVEMRPPARVPENTFPKDGNGQVRPQPIAAPRPAVQPSSPISQVPAPVRPVIPASVKSPEVAPRPVAAPEPMQRAIAEPRPVAPPQNPAPRPAVTPEPMQRAMAEPRPGMPQAPAPRLPVQSPVQTAVPRSPQNFVQAPASPAAPPPAPKPVAIAAPTLPAVASTPVLEPTPRNAPEVTLAAPSGIQSDADILELFKYGKGQAQAKDFKDPDELPPSNSKKWVFISLGSIVVIAAVVAFLFLRSQHVKTPAAPIAPQVESGSLTTQATSTSSASAPAQTSAVPASEPTIAKPSPTVPLVVNPAQQATNQSAPVSSEMMDAQLSAQSKISKDIKSVSPAEEPPASGLTPVSMDNGGGVKDASLGGFGKVNVVPVVSQVSAGVAEGMAIHKTPPVYPKIAKDSRVGGTVVLAATINRSGLLENVRVISGSQMLRGAAVEAVKTWRYRPYMLNNQPVAVQTTINVVFSLGKE